MRDPVEVLEFGRHLARQLDRVRGRPVEQAGEQLALREQCETLVSSARGLASSLVLEESSPTLGQFQELLELVCRIGNGLRHL
jgi:hypothetical protein